MNGASSMRNSSGDITHPWRRLIEIEELAAVVAVDAHRVVRFGDDHLAQFERLLELLHLVLERLAPHRVVRVAVRDHGVARACLRSVVARGECE